MGSRLEQFTKVDINKISSEMAMYNTTGSYVKSGDDGYLKQRISELEGEVSRLNQLTREMSNGEYLAQKLDFDRVGDLKSSIAPTLAEITNVLHQIELREGIYSQSQIGLDT